MWGVYRETDAGTALEGAEWCHLISSHEEHLVAWGGNQIRVYRLNPYVPKQNEDGSIKPTTSLECILSDRFLAPIASLCVCRIPGSPRDGLIAGFDDAKLSVLAYDPQNHTLATISLHAFEEEILKGGFTRDFQRSVLRGDPDDRCAAMLVYARHLAVLPLTSSKATDSAFDDLEEMQAGKNVYKGDPMSLPHVTLFSYVVSLESLDERLCNVVDMAFLNGYYEPTLLFLFEPTQTTTGRIAIRQDTYSILAVSLNVKDKVEAVIWTVNNLPFDALRCYAVPKPIGGALVVTSNSIIYLNQSVPSYGVAVNSRLEGATSFPLRDEKDKQMILDSAATDFILPSTLMLNLVNGQLWTITLLVDNTNAVKGIHLEKNSVSINHGGSCLRALSDGYFFIASRLGDSALVKYSEQDSIPFKVSSDGKVTGAGGSREKVATGGGGGRVMEELDDLAIYGEVVAVQTVETMRVSQYSLNINQIIKGYGPCKDLGVGIPAYIPTPLKTQQLDPIVDVAMAIGNDKSGAVAVYQRQIRPNILTSSQIDGALQLWTVGRRSDHLSEEDVEGGLIADSHKLLLVSKQVLTMVLELGNEISELETSGFCMDQRTVGAGDLRNGEYIIQVCTMCVVLLRGTERVDLYQLAISFPVAFVSIADPFVILLTENGQILMLQLVPSKDGGHGIEIIENNTGQVPAMAISAYIDHSGLFVVSNGDPNNPRGPDGKPLINPDGSRNASSSGFGRGGGGTRTKKESSSSSSHHEKSIGSFANSSSVDDEDALLYGADSQKPDSKPQIFGESALNPQEIFFEEKIAQSAVINPNEVEPTHWLFVVRENGLLEILTLPDFKPVFLCKKFPHSYPTLFAHDPYQFNLDVERADEHYPIVKEMEVVGLGPHGCRPHLMAIVADELIIYEIFHFDEGYPDHLAIRLKKVHHTATLRNERLVKGRKRPLESEGPGSSVSQSQLDAHLKILQPFSNVKGYNGELVNGIFMAAPYPFRLIRGSFFSVQADFIEFEAYSIRFEGYVGVVMSKNGELRTHPMSLEGPISSLTPFHNQNCQHGFLYLTKKFEVRFCQLGDKWDIDASCPVRKVELERNVHFIEYLLDSNTYAVASSITQPNNILVSWLGDDKQFEKVDKSDDANFILPKVRQFTVEIFDSDTWSPVPNAGHLEMDQFEHVSDMKEVQLKSESTITGVQNYLAIGTIYNYGEEVLVRGRVFLCEVIEVVPEPGQPLTKNKIKTVYKKEQKGPVTSLCAVGGYMLTAMASKVYIWQFRDNDLQGISFIDMQFYIHSMVGLRNMALVADIYKSVSLLRYQEYAKALSLSSRDFRIVPNQAVPMGIDYMVDNKELAFLMSDEDNNLNILTFDPEDKSSKGGQILVPKGDINIGTRVNKFARIQSHVSDPLIENKVQCVNRHINLFGTLDGGLGFIMPIPERSYRRLHTLQVAMMSHVAHLGGMNPKGARALRGMKGGTFTPHKNILDANLLFQYLNLSFTEKQDLAKRIGSSKDQLLDDLLEIHRLSTHF